MKQNDLKITVALVCHREKEALAYILEDLKKQTAFDSIGEVLIFQNGDCELTRKMAESFLDQLPLKFFSSPLNNLGLARATLVNQSQYDLMAWTDSDCRLPNNWLKELLSHWKNNRDNSVVAIGGPNVLPEKKWWQKMVNLSLSHPLGHGWSPQAWRVKKKTKVSHIPTTNGLFLKKAILEAGNFSEKYKRAGEDMDLGLRLNKKGKLLLFPQPVVINNYANSYFESLKRLFVFGQVKSEYKNFLSYLSFFFCPLIICFFILGIFQKFFLFFPLCHFVILFLASALIGFKNKKIVSLLLPFFWFLQQMSYSAGTVVGMFVRVLNKFQKY